jgi:hypothetical protein
VSTRCPQAYPQAAKKAVELWTIEKSANSVRIDSDPLELRRAAA